MCLSEIFVGILSFKIAHLSLIESQNRVSELLFSCDNLDESALSVYSLKRLAWKYCLV